jgi:pimeloyl-ACP methyl ester carboxylesterase
MNKVISADGTPIAVERFGDGSPVVVVGGATCDRAVTRPLAQELARYFTVLNYDRRGRGDSGDTAPYAVEREIEDLGAVIASAGGAAAVYGHSSGAVLRRAVVGAQHPDKMRACSPPSSTPASYGRACSATSCGWWLHRSRLIQ